VSEPTAAELEWVAGYVSIATELAAEAEADRFPPSIDELDSLWAVWLQDGRPEDANDMVQVIGFAFGQRLVEELGMRWVVASDELGTEIALHHPLRDTLMYPVNLVAKGWKSRETGFRRPIYDELRARLRQRRARVRRDAALDRIQLWSAVCAGSAAPVVAAQLPWRFSGGSEREPGSAA